MRQYTHPGKPAQNMSSNKIRIHIECYNLYYKYVNKVDKLTSIVLTPIGEEPNP